MFIDKESFVPGKAIETKTLKPSAALRKGSALRPQCRGLFYYADRTCALGAMYEGYFGLDEILKLGRAVYSSLIEASGMSAGILTVIQYRDDRGETRESIADWLESQGL